MNHLFGAVRLAILSSSLLSAQTSISPVTSAAMEIDYAHASEASPLTPLAYAQRKAALAFSGNDHSSHVILCFTLFKDVLANRSNHAEDIKDQYIISAAAYLYEHPEQASDHHAVNLAGSAAALEVYAKFLEQESGTRSKFLDDLQKDRLKGKLSQRVAAACNRGGS